jgi:hypothetical protein
MTCSRVANESLWTSSRTDMVASVKKYEYVSVQLEVVE